MFDLEQSIAVWRKQMLAAGIQSPVPLAELEVHLREEIERQVKSGLGRQNAFEMAAEKIGRPRELKTEFRKISVPVVIRIVKLAGIACGVVGSLLLLWTVYVSLFIREANWGVRIFGLLALAAIILSWRHGGRFLPAIRRPQVRAAVGLAACVAGVGGTLVFIGRVLPGLFVFSDGAGFSLNRLLVAFVIAWTVMAILGVFACQLEEAGQKGGLYV
jgi:hypothetical protein